MAGRGGIRRARRFFRQLAVVAWKELLDAARDRRSLASAVAFALFGPLVVGMALSALQARTDDDRPLRLAAVGVERAPALLAALERHGAEVVPAASADALHRAVRGGRETVGLVIGARYGEERRELRPASVTVVWDRSRSASSRDARRLGSALAGFQRAEGDRRLLLRGVAPRVARPLEVERRDLSTPASRAATALAMVPIFLLMATFIGGMNVAIDVTAGERERGSLEPLLLPATPRSALATGKWLAAVVPNLLVVAATLAVTVAVVRSPRLGGLGLRFGDEAVAGVALALLPLALMGPALQMLASLFSTSYKEAQTYLSLLVMLPALPGFLFVFRDLEPTAWMRWTPILGHQVAVGDLLRGVPPAALDQMLLAASTLTLALACLAGVTAVLGRERVLSPG